MAFDGLGLAFTISGGVLLWSAIQNVTVQDILQSLAKGTAPSKGAPVSYVDSSGTSSSSASAAGSTDATVASNASETQWINALLSGIGAQATAANVSSLTNWIAHEQPWPPSNNNPLNTTQDEPGAQTFNSVGVKSYPSLQVGLDATIATLNNGAYGDILMLLRSGQGLKSGASAGLAKWSGNGYTSV